MIHRPSPPPSATRAARRVPPVLRALPSLAAAGAAGLLAACASGGGSGGSGMAVTAPAVVVGSTPPSSGLSGLDTLTQPFEITSQVTPQGRVLNATLRAAFDTLVVPQAYNGGTLVTDTMVLRTWQVINANGGVDYQGFPGPTLRAFPGDSIHIVLQNRLFPLDSDSTCMNYPADSTGTDTFQDCFHGANWTNIHYHGMHVTPDSVGDDVLLLIPPGEDYTYGFRIPYNQSPGTHWYHPHKHGSVAIQVQNGMSGAIIVDGGPLDRLADSLGIAERVISMQQIDSLPNLMDAPVGTFPNAPLTLVNGKLTPVVVMAPGEVQRWRIVDENVTKTAAFRVAFEDLPGEEPAMYDVARDGVTYADTNYAPNGVLTRDTAVIVAPGNRLDLFVKAPGGAGLYRVRATSIAHDRRGDNTRKEDLSDDQNPATPNPRLLANAAATTASPPAALFYVYVDSTRAPVNTQVPTSLPAPLPFLDNLPGTLDPNAILADSANLAVVIFNSTGSQSVATPPKFYLGTVANPLMQFNSDSVYVPRNAFNDSLPMVLDSVQAWKVVNTTAVNHPFHIHINPFQVIDVYYPNPADPNAALYAQLDSAAQQRGTPIWLDVIPLPQVSASGDTAGYVLIRQGYEPFTNADGSICTNCGPPYGQFVMHCHILGHEERGMMQVIEIVPEAGQQPGPVRSGGRHGFHPATGSGSGPGTGGGGGRGGGNGSGHDHRH